MKASVFFTVAKTLAPLLQEHPANQREFVLQFVSLSTCAIFQICNVGRFPLEILGGIDLEAECAGSGPAPAGDKTLSCLGFMHVDM